MRIGIDIRSLIEEAPSGVTEYTRQLLKHLLQIDKENQYLLFYNAIKPLPKKYASEFDQSNVTLKAFRYPNKILNSFLAFIGFPKIDKMIGGVDVIFSPNFNFLSISSRCKYLLTIHDLSFIKYPSFYTYKGRAWHRFIQPKRLIKRSDALIAVSANTKSDLISHFNIESDKVSVVYSGIDFDFFSDIDVGKKEKIKEKYGLNKPYILSLGNVEPRKNIDSLISAFDTLKKNYNLDHQLVIIGSGQKNYCDKLKKQSSFSESIKFLGYIPYTDKPYLYHLSSLFVYPSLYEGFGFPPLEAMACGVPVVCSNSSSLPEIVDESGLLVDSNNINELAQSMQNILEDDNLRQKYIRMGKSRVQDFSWKKTAEKTLRIIKSM